MATVIGVRFKKAGKVYYFSPGEVWPKPGENVIVETTRGIELGEVVTGTREVDDSSIVAPLKNVLRKATDEDIAISRRNEKREEEAFGVCVQKIAQHKLEMKLVSVEYTFDDSKIIFYFTANGRVDFRDLVKDLAGIFHMRIELRQIGVRDEAKMLGGLGACGRQICCGAFLGDFQPVSIKMAKEQNLSLNPTKISGQCGRLMCCLKYEQDYYEETLKKLPKVGKEIMTPDGVGYVTEISVLREKVKVRVKTGDDNFEVREYGVEDVRRLAPGERPVEGELPPKIVEKLNLANDKKEEEESAEENKKRRYPRPKVAKTLNTDQYMELHADQPDTDENQQKDVSQSQKEAQQKKRPPKNADRSSDEPEAGEGERPRHFRNENRRGRGHRGRPEGEAKAEEKPEEPEKV